MTLAIVGASKRRRDSAAIVKDAVMKHYKCVLEIKMKAEFENGCGPRKDAQSRGLDVGLSTLCPWYHSESQPCKMKT